MSRLEWVLGILLVGLLIVVVVLSLVFWFGPNAASNEPANSGTVIAQRAVQVAPTSEFEGNTAKIAYAQAQQAALGWQPDAKLMKASATWPNGTAVQDMRQGETTWGFTFYSPAARQIAVVSVVEEEANIISEADHTQSSQLLEVTGWNIDSNEAIRQLLRQGGNQFIGDEGVTTLAMQLKTDNANGDGRMEWEMNLISLKSARAMKLRLDATSGEILENITVP